MENFEYEAEVTRVNNFTDGKGIEVAIAVFIKAFESTAKSLRTGILFKRGVSECKFVEGDQITALVVPGQPTKITSTKCIECPFGGNNGKPISGQTCNIFTRTK